MESGHCSSERLRREEKEAEEIEEAEEVLTWRFLAVAWCESESRRALKPATAYAVLVAVRKCFLLLYE